MSNQNRKDGRGIFSFLTITFFLTYLIEGIILASGISFSNAPPMMAQLIVAGVMWVPALATVITIRFITREGFDITNFRFGSIKPYLFAAGLMPVMFVVIYGLTWLFGLGSPDWQLEGFRRMMIASGAPAAEFPSSSLVIPGLFIISILVGPTINGLFGFGEEFGWRGYLLPKLMPLGKWKAYTLLGFIWGLWHAPLVVAGFNYPGYPIAGVIWMIGLTFTLGIIINEFTLRYRSSVLAGSIHGAFNGQAYGIWRILFPDVNSLLGGMTGLIGIIVMGVVGLMIMKKFEYKDSQLP